MLALCLFTAFLIIVGAPDTLAGKALRRALVEWPATRLSRLTRGQMVCGAGALATVAAALWLLEGDALRMISLALPEATVWFTTFEISTIVDVLVAVALLSAQTRLRPAVHNVRAALGAVRRRIGPRNRNPRSRRSGSRKADNDDADGPGFRYAMAA